MPSPSGLAGRELPAGTARLEPYQNWLLHDAFYSEPRPEPHPVAAFILANRGIGISLADLFTLFGSDINDGPLLAESQIELHRPLAEDADYEVRGEITAVEHRQSRRIGPFDRITCLFDLLQDGTRAATVTNVFAIPREPKGAVAAWTPLVPTGPPQARGACDERQGPAAAGGQGSKAATQGRPEASGIAEQLGEVDPARMKMLALLLADPNPIHFDRAAARRLAGTDQVVNQGPSTMALGVNMLLAAFPGARLVSYRVRLLGLVLAGDGVEGGGTVIDREIRAGQYGGGCPRHRPAPARGRVIEGEAVLVLAPSELAGWTSRAD
jgi:acyl dehydratase